MKLPPRLRANAATVVKPTNLAMAQFDKVLHSHVDKGDHVTGHNLHSWFDLAERGENVHTRHLVVTDFFEDGRRQLFEDDQSVYVALVQQSGRAHLRPAGGVEVAAPSYGSVARTGCPRYLAGTTAQ